MDGVCIIDSGYMSIICAVLMFGILSNNRLLCLPGYVLRSYIYSVAY